jgi:hypothetical protein
MAIRLVESPEEMAELMGLSLEEYLEGSLIVAPLSKLPSSGSPPSTTRSTKPTSSAPQPRTRVKYCEDHRASRYRVAMHRSRAR